MIISVGLSCDDPLSTGKKPVFPGKNGEKVKKINFFSEKGLPKSHLCGIMYP